MDEGRTTAGPTTPVSPASGAEPAATPDLVGSATNPSSPAGAGAQAGLAGQGTGPAGVTPVAAPGLQALQILGIPVFALPPEVVAALPSEDDGRSGTGTQAGGGTATEAGPQGAGTGAGAATGTETGPGTGAGIGAAAGSIGAGVGTPVATGTGGQTTGSQTTGGGGNTTGGQNTGGQTTGGQNTGGQTTGGGGTTPPPATDTDFCGPAHDLSNAMNAVAAAQSPGALESAVNWARSAFVTAQATAPPSLDADVDTLANASGSFFDDLEAAGYDRQNVGTGSFGTLSSSEVKAANARFNQYVIDVC
jgi:hypothetical protein